jgi:L-alanine-DL-glutamate epimerase-like enolase superfamily enzyme
MTEEAFDKVNTYSAPSALKITDMRVATLASIFDVPIIRIDTNQDVYGLGEVRDAGHREEALRYKSLLLGENPLNLDKLFRRMEPYAVSGRESGGISGIEMALWDILGKVYGVPCYVFLGGKYRDRIRVYGDTPSPKTPTPEGFAERARSRGEMGLTWIKFDLGIRIFEEVDVPGAVIGTQLTDKGIAYMVEIVEAVRGAVGWDTPLCIDHFGPLSLNDCIRLGHALEPFSLAWLEDMIPWRDVEGNRQVTQAIRTPTANGEDIFGVEGFRPFVEQRAIDIVHPDLASAGGLRETKRIADLAARHRMSCALHFAGSPISLMANLHAAAAIPNFLALEHHSLDIPWWEDLVIGPEKPFLVDGYIKVPEGAGLGVELNHEVVSEHLRYPGYFDPTPEWDIPKLGFYRPPGPVIGEDVEV